MVAERALVAQENFRVVADQKLNVLTPMVRVIDRFLPLPPLSIIAILRKPPANAAQESASSLRSESAVHEAAQ